MTTTTASALGAYLARLDLHDRPPATLGTLVDVHRRHLAAIPYENLGIMLGRPPSVDPAASLARVGRTGRAGYCFHQNGAMEVALRGLGFAVSRRHGHVWIADHDRDDGSLNHLALVVSGLPTDDNPGGDWWADVGLGEGGADPLPLRVAGHGDGDLAVEIESLAGRGWSYRHHRLGSFRGIEVRDLPIGQAEVEAAHARLSTPPDGVFSRILVVQRRTGRHVDTLRGCVLSRFGPRGSSARDVTSYADWRAALTDGLGLPVDDVPGDELRSLWRRMREAHDAWDVRGRP